MKMVAGAIACSGVTLPAAYGDNAVDRNETWINATSPIGNLAEAALTLEATATAAAARLFCGGVSDAAERYIVRAVRVVLSVGPHSHHAASDIVYGSDNSAAA